MTSLLCITSTTTHAHNKLPQHRKLSYKSRAGLEKQLSADFASLVKFGSELSKTAANRIMTKADNTVSTMQTTVFVWEDQEPKIFFTGQGAKYYFTV